MVRFLVQVGDADEQPDSQQAAAPHRAASPTTAAEAPPADVFADLLGGELPAKPPQPEPQPAPDPQSPSPAAGSVEAEVAGGAWVPLQLALGLPLTPEALNQEVCRNALVRLSTHTPPQLTSTA